MLIYPQNFDPVVDNDSLLINNDHHYQQAKFISIWDNDQIVVKINDQFKLANFHGSLSLWTISPAHFIQNQQIDYPLFINKILPNIHPDQVDDFYSKIDRLAATDVYYLKTLKKVMSPDNFSIPDIDSYVSLDDWFDLNKKIPHFRKGDPMLYQREEYQWIDDDDFEYMIDDIKNLYQETYQPSNKWLDNNVPTIEETHDPIFVQKVKVPSNAKVFMVGDLHSSIRSFIHILKHLHKTHRMFTDIDVGFKLNPNFYLFFLGDIVDRGPYSLELLTLICQLKLENRNQVYIINGNHEDRNTYSRYGLLEETLEQFDLENRKKTLRYLNFLHYFPSAIYLQKGEKLYQLNHGAVTPYQDEKNKIKRLIKSNTHEYAFMRYHQIFKNGRQVFKTKDTDCLKWGDFNAKIDDIIGMDTSRPNFGYQYVKDYIQELGLTAILSGHQDKSSLLLFLKEDRKNDHIRFELDPIYGKKAGMYRSKNYNKILGNNRWTAKSYYPGRDYLALCTSSAIGSKGSKNLNYDCYIHLK